MMGLENHPGKFPNLGKPGPGLQSLWGEDSGARIQKAPQGIPTGSQGWEPQE